MSPGQNRHGSDLLSHYQPQPDLRHSAWKQEPAGVFWWSVLEGKMQATQTPQTVPAVDNILYHIKTLVGIEVKKGLSILKGLQDPTVETRFLWTFAHLSLRPLTGHVHHSVICGDFQPGVLQIDNIQKFDGAKWEKISLQRCNFPFIPVQTIFC